MTLDMIVNVLLFGFLVLTTLVLVAQRNLFVVTMLFVIFSLLSAGIFLILDAGDVALTEAAVGGVLSIFLLIAVACCRQEQSPRRHSPVLPLIVVTITGLALIYGTTDMPAFGDPQAAMQTHVAPRYIEQGPTETGVPNMVTAVLASYRAYDTLGEVAVIFAGGVGVLLVLGGGITRRTGKENGDER
jgi:multicomponent Na+:H+ antiporter subunit B